MLPYFAPFIGLLSIAAALSACPAQDAAPAQQPAAAAQAAPAAANFMSAVQLLPPSTAGYLRAINLPAARQAWDKTTIAKLGTTPAMQPFWDAQEETLENQLLAAGLKVGLRLSDLYDITSGELLVGWMSYPDPKRPYTVCLVSDIRGRRAVADAALTTLDNNMKIRKAARRDLTHQGQTIRVYTLPKAPGQFKIDQIAVTVNDQRLIAADRDSTVRLLLDGLKPQPKKVSLLNSGDHAQIWKRVGPSESDEVQWFARPLALARIMREIAGTDRGQRVDIVKLLERQGFTAIHSAGGRVEIDQNEYDLLHHGYIYAPRPAGGGERLKLAARMLAFPNHPPTPLPNWIDTDASSCLRLHWKMEEAFWAAETLVDDAFGSDIFRPTLEGIREDVEGPQIDIPKDIVAHFDDQLFHITDNVNSDSDRTLVAIRLNNTAVVAAAINKAMGSEPDATRSAASPEHPIWEVVPNVQEDFDDTNFGDFGFAEEEEEEDQPAPLLERWAITVIADPATGTPGGGYLMFSSHASQLVETVGRIRQGTPGEFEQQPDVQAVTDQILALQGNSRFLGYVNRTRKSWRVNYELLRQGTLRESDSILGNLLRRVHESRQNNMEDPELHADKLPPYEAIEEFLNPVGGFMQTEPDGWHMRGFLLK